MPPLGTRTVFTRGTGWLGLPALVGAATKISAAIPNNVDAEVSLGNSKRCMLSRLRPNIIHCGMFSVMVDFLVRIKRDRGACRRTAIANQMGRVRARGWNSPGGNRAPFLAEYDSRGLGRPDFRSCD